MKFDLQRQFCNAKLNYKIYYYDHDIRGYLICSSHKFSPFGRVGHLTFCYCYWQFVVSFLLSGTEGQRGKQSASKKEIHRERGTAREGNQLAIYVHVWVGFMKYFSLLLRGSLRKHIWTIFISIANTHTQVYILTQTDTETHTHSQCCDWHGAEINWIAISHMKWSFVNEHNNWGWSVGCLVGGLDNARRLRRACPCAVCQMAA